MQMLGTAEVPGVRVRVSSLSVWTQRDGDEARVWSSSLCGPQRSVCLADSPRSSV